MFARQNVAEDPPFSRLDLISCRNVLIYLEPVLQKRMMSLFHYALKPTGFLMLGTAETIGPSSDLFALVDKAHKIYAKKLTSSRVPVDVRLTPSAGERRAAALPIASRAEIEQPPFDLQREADRVVMARYAPPGVVINDDMEILQFRGHTGPYLEPAPGDASFNLLKMARQGLLHDLRGARAPTVVARVGDDLEVQGPLRALRLARAARSATETGRRGRLLAQRGPRGSPRRGCGDRPRWWTPSRDRRPTWRTRRRSRPDRSSRAASPARRRRNRRRMP